LKRAGRRRRLADHVLGIRRGAAINIFTRAFVAHHDPGIFCAAASLCFVKGK
jgi:hypothetical protein